MADLSKLSEKEFEDLCTGCGECCLIRMPVKGYGFSCPRLNLSNRRCRNYEKRAEEELCHKLTPENVPKLSGPGGPLPDDCSYVRYMNDEKPYKLPSASIARLAVIPFKKLPLRERQKYWVARGRKVNPSSDTPEPCEQQSKTPLQ